MYKEPTIIQGGSYTDDRGTIDFVNDFHFEGVKRFYTITHPDTFIVRAWQGHTSNAKYFYPTNGTWLIAWVKMDFTIPEENWKAEHVIIKAADSKLLCIPPGFANGLKALEKGSTITVFTVPGEEEEINLRWDWKRWMDWDAVEMIR
jgi:dTDP-4-dehydrorhamnose 3,5-epimerase-like enzyme